MSPSTMAARHYVREQEQVLAAGESGDSSSTKRSSSRKKSSSGKQGGKDRPSTKKPAETIGKRVYFR
jgi:hypothetical protein